MISNPFKKWIGNADNPDAGEGGGEEDGVHAAIHQVLHDAAALRKSGQPEQAADMLEEAFLRFKPHPVLAYRLVASLLELGQYARILKFPAARPFNSRDFAIAEFLGNVDPGCIDTLPQDSQPAAEHIGYVTMVKDEEDIILFNLVWHYHLGLRRFFVIDNLSGDRTPELVQLFAARFPDAMVLMLRDPVVAHFKGRKVSGACQFMRTLWPELQWIALLDADEFLCPCAPLASILDAVEAEVEAVVVPRSVYRLTTEEAASGTEPFFHRITQRQALSHLSNKIIVRAAVAHDISQGNHRLAEPNRLYSSFRYASSLALTMREFPVRSFGQFSRKVINGGTAVAAALDAGFENVGGGHWAGQHATFKAQGLAGLKKKFLADIQASGTQTLMDDPMPLDAVMDRLLPDWREIVPASAGRQG